MATQYTAGLTTGQVLTAATMNSIGAAWETWTPQLWSGVTQATTSTATGLYCLINKVAIVHVYLNANGSGAAGAVEVRNRPAAITPKRTGSANNSNGSEIGTAGYLDSGTAFYPGAMYWNSSTALRILVAGGVDLSLTTATGDKMTFTMVYEVA
jgi:hypothetical protein